jgi:hypothetical protein
MNDGYNDLRFFDCINHHPQELAGLVPAEGKRQLNEAVQAVKNQVQGAKSNLMRVFFELCTQHNLHELSTKFREAIQVSQGGMFLNTITGLQKSSDY